MAICRIRAVVRRYKECEVPPTLFTACRAVFCLAVPLGAMACTPTLDIQTRDAYGPAIRYNGMGDTYDWWPGTKLWVQHALANNLASGEVYDYIDDMIQEQLDKRGFTLVTEGKPSFYVAYRIHRKLQATYDVDPHGQMIEEGSIVIDAVDPDTDKIIWRGIASAQLNVTYTPEVRRQRVQFGINKLMQKFPARTAKPIPNPTTNP